MRQPVRVQANVGDSGKAAERAVEGSAFHDLLYRRVAVVRAHVEVEDGLPQRNQKNEVPLLPGVFLRDLKFDGLVGVAESGEERRGRLAHLKINGAVLDLDDHVVVELAVEWMKNVIRGAGAVGLRVAPVEVMVVDEGAVEQHAAMRLEGAGQRVGSINGRAAILRWAGLALGVGLD